jgi:phasin family protein
VDTIGHAASPKAATVPTGQTFYGHTVVGALVAWVDLTTIPGRYEAFLSTPGNPHGVDMVGLGDAILQCTNLFAIVHCSKGIEGSGRPPGPSAYSLPAGGSAMQNVDTKQITAQFESLFFGPARAYAGLSVDFTEKLVNAQLDATKAYADTGLAQARNLLNVKDVEGLRAYLESQQKVAQELTERLKGDAEKVVSLQQDFVQQSQKLTEANVKQAQQVAESNVKQVSETASKAAEATSKAASKQA